MKHVLVVEPDAKTADALADGLAEAGYVTSVASSANEALSYMETNGAPWAAIIDLQLPDLGPLELLTVIRARSDKALPTFFVSRSPRRVHRFALSPVLVAPFEPLEARVVMLEAMLEAESRKKSPTLT